MNPRVFSSVGFQFWGMYGSWSWCRDCGSFFFNDAFFRERVYLLAQTSAQPELMASCRDRVPSDAYRHARGAVGPPSRW